jgi:hypothetical protein
MTKASTIAALAVIVSAPALLGFASGSMPATSLGLWYLASLVVVGSGVHLVKWLVTSYSAISAQKAKDDEEHSQA